MSKHTLYAYVEDSDLEEIAAAVMAGLVDFVDKTQWMGAAPVVVNQRHSAEGLREGDLPLWDLGLNVALPEVGHECDGWFGDVEIIALFLARLREQFHRDFVLGVAIGNTGIAEDLFYVDSGEPNLEELRQIIGVLQ
ncbi:MAG: hypothetical protein QE488_02835 [Acidovorax sp.]|nr:hypothetical protein [Acidovorax sp.]